MSPGGCFGFGGHEHEIDRIPLIGFDSIPLRDEIEMEMTL